MFKNFFKTAWRNIRKNKLFSFINILGLSIGIAVCFIIMLYVQDELSYDKFNKNANNIARVVFHANISGGKINESIVMAPVAQTMKRDFPEVQDATRLVAYGISKITYKNKVFKDDRFAFVDPNFFSIFTLPMIEGDAKTALLQPNTVVITQKTAKKYFGNEDAIGKTIKYTTNNKETYKVTGVMKDIPANSHFHFDMFGSMKSLEGCKLDTWMGGSFYTYLLLKPGTDYRKMEASFPAWLKKYMGPQIQQANGFKPGAIQNKRQFTWLCIATIN